jgi:hypothetical protein
MLFLSPVSLRGDGGDSSLPSSLCLLFFRGLKASYCSLPTIRELLDVRLNETLRQC